LRRKANFFASSLPATVVETEVRGNKTVALEVTLLEDGSMTIVFEEDGYLYLVTTSAGIDTDVGYRFVEELL